MPDQNRFDHIVVGLGIAGAAVALQLAKRGKRIAVFNEPAMNKSSSVAAGLFNPIAGKLMVKTWKADDFFPYLISFYREAEILTSSKFLFERPIYIPFRSAQEQNDWETQSEDKGMKPYINKVFASPVFGDQVSDDLGGLLLNRSGYVQVSTYLEVVRELVRSRGALFEKKMDYSKLRLSNESVDYENISARSLILCEGLHAKGNPLTSWLPVQPLKGETIDVHFANELQAIYNRGVYAVPLGKGMYRIGATFERTDQPGNSVAGKAELETKLRSLVRVPYEVVAQNWGFRPTTRDRKPLVGAHPQHANVFILNGLGTKGVSQAPYFSMVLADYLQGKVQIGPEANISRFYALSSKSRD